MIKLRGKISWIENKLCHEFVTLANQRCKKDNFYDYMTTRLQLKYLKGDAISRDLFLPVFLKPEN